MSQKAKVASILKEKGYIDNVHDCVKTALTLRLSNKIRELEAEGWIFDENKSGYYPPKSKNWRYYLKEGVRQPWMPKYKFEMQGDVMMQIPLEYGVR